MAPESSLSDPNLSDPKVNHGKGHLTTRRGFVTGLSFGVLSLYGLWAAYGAAPTSISFLSNDEGGGMAGMGHGGGGGPTPEEFRDLTEKFIEANQLPDGRVKPVRNALAGKSMTGEMGKEHVGEKAKEHVGKEENVGEKAHVGEEANEHAGEGAHAGEEVKEPAGKHDMQDMPGMKAEDEHDGKDRPVEVYLVAARYGYTPSVLRLEHNVKYRFKIMAVDAVHGASINFGVGGRMIRCPPMTQVEIDMTFTKPGNLLVYCTVYCGEGHDLMHGKIIVA